MSLRMVIKLSAQNASSHFCLCPIGHHSPLLFCLLHRHWPFTWGNLAKMPDMVFLRDSHFTWDTVPVDLLLTLNPSSSLFKCHFIRNWLVDYFIRINPNFLLRYTWDSYLWLCLTLILSYSTCYLQILRAIYLSSLLFVPQWRVNSLWRGAPIISCIKSFLEYYQAQRYFEHKSNLVFRIA